MSGISEEQLGEFDRASDVSDDANALARRLKRSVAEIRRLRAENEGLKTQLHNADTALARVVCEEP